MLKLLVVIIAQDSDELVLDLTSYNDDLFICAGRYTTLIKPEYIEAYDTGVETLVKGIILDTSQSTELPDGETVITTVFGIMVRRITFTSTGQDARLIIPRVARTSLPLFEGNEEGAVHGFHVGLINEVNLALGGLKSPYRLAPLAFDA